MAKVKIVSGAYGYKPAGAVSVKAITAESGPIEVSDAEAERLVRLKVAVIVDAPAEVTPEMPPAAVATAHAAEEAAGECMDTPDGESETEGQETACLDAEQLKGMTVAELRALAEDMGIDCSRLRTKAQLIAAICDVPIEDCIEEEAAEDEEAGDDGEEPPELTAEAPVV